MTDSNMEFILKMGCFMYIMSSKGPRIDPWETPCFNFPKLEKQF